MILTQTGPLSGPFMFVLLLRTLGHSVSLWGLKKKQSPAPGEGNPPRTGVRSGVRVFLKPTQPTARHLEAMYFPPSLKGANASCVSCLPSQAPTP